MSNIQKQMQELFGHSCYAYAIAYLYGNKRTIYELTEAVLDGWKAGFISTSGFVSAPQKFANLLIGKDKFKDVRKPTCKPEDQNEFIVEWQNPNGGSHFTVEDKDTLLTDKALFDPSGDSISRKYNKIISFREFIK